MAGVTATAGVASRFVVVVVGVMTALGSLQKSLVVGHLDLEGATDGLEGWVFLALAVGETALVGGLVGGFIGFVDFFKGKVVIGMGCLLDG